MNAFSDHFRSVLALLILAVAMLFGAAGLVGAETHPEPWSHAAADAHLPPLPVPDRNGIVSLSGCEDGGCTTECPPCCSDMGNAGCNAPVVACLGETALSAFQRNVDAAETWPEPLLDSLSTQVGERPPRLAA